MKHTKNKLHALLFTLVMVTSVFAGSVALAGSVAADVSSEISAGNGPIEYTETNGNTLIDVMFTEKVAGANFRLLDKDDTPVALFEVGGASNALAANGQIEGPEGFDVGNVLAPNPAQRPTITRFTMASSEDLSGGATLQLLAANNTGITDDINFSVTTTSATIADGLSHVSSNAATQDTTDGQDAVAYVGSNVAVLSGNAQETGNAALSYEISTGGSFIRSGDSGNPFVVNVEDTSDLTAGTTYNFTFGDTDAETQAGNLEQLEMRSLGLTATADSTSLDRVEEGTATLEAEIGSTVQGRTVTAELINSSGDVEQTSSLTIGGDRTVDAVFEVDADDTYTILATDDNTNITAETDAIVVSEVDGTASFTQSVFTEQRGDIAEITIDMNNVERANVSIGAKAGQSDIGYGATADVNDTDGDGSVTLQFNTFTPNSNVDADPLSADGDDDIIDGSVSTSGTVKPLDAGTYDINVSVGNEEQDVATLSLTALSADAFTVLTGPPETDITDADATSDFDAFEAAGNLTESSSIASGDIVVHKIEASGLGGSIANVRASSDDDEEAFEKLLKAGDVKLNITQTEASTATNQDPKELLNSTKTLDSASSDEFGALKNVNVVLDGSNDTFYFNFPVTRGANALDNTRQINDGDEFVANLTLFEGDLFNDDVVVTQTFSVNNRSVELDETGENADGDNIITVEATTGQTVTGETNLAPGSEIEVRARATGTDPFLLSQTVDTDSSGDFSATFDLSSIEVGTNFTFTATSGDGGSAELDAELVDQVSETPEPTESPAPTEEPTATPEPTATATEEPTATETPGQPGFGVIVALLAFMAAALLAIRRD